MGIRVTAIAWCGGRGSCRGAVVRCAVVVCCVVVSVVCAVSCGAVVRWSLSLCVWCSVLVAGWLAWAIVPGCRLSMAGRLVGRAGRRWAVVLWCHRPGRCAAGVRGRWMLDEDRDRVSIGCVSCAGPCFGGRLVVGLVCVRRSWGILVG